MTEYFSKTISLIIISLGINNITTFGNKKIYIESAINPFSKTRQID